MQSQTNQKRKLTAIEQSIKKITPQPVVKLTRLQDPSGFVIQEKINLINIQESTSQKDEGLTSPQRLQQFRIRPLSSEKKQKEERLERLEQSKSLRDLDTPEDKDKQFKFMMTPNLSMQNLVGNNKKETKEKVNLKETPLVKKRSINVEQDKTLTLGTDLVSPISPSNQTSKKLHLLLNKALGRSQQ